MTNYRLYCFDHAGSVVCRDDFEAETNAEAKGIASAICDACSDAHHRYELWKGDLPIESGVTMASVLRLGGLSVTAQRTVMDREVAIRDSFWRVSQSRKLNDRIEELAFSFSG